MSIRALNWAFAQKLENSSHKFVLVALADSADDYGICWPSYNTIAEKCSIARRSAIRAINEMTKLGLITKKARYKAEGQNSNAFQLQMGVKISDDHPLKDLVSQSHPLVTESHPPSDTVSPKSTTEPLKEKKPLSRNEFMQEVDRGYKADAFKDWPHLTETEIFNAAEACLDFFGAKGEWPAGQPVYVVRHWIRGGIQKGTIRKTDKPETGFHESKPEIKRDDLPMWKLAILKKVDEKTYKSWFEQLQYSEGKLYAPTKFHRDHLRAHYEYIINTALGHTEIEVREPEYA